MTATFPAITGTGGAVQFTTSGSRSVAFDTLTTAAQAQPFTTSSMAAGTAIQPRTAYSTPTLASGTYQVYSIDFTPEVDPTPAGYFWALQFGTSGGDGGYFGMQTLGSGLPGKCAVFSIANAISGTGSGIVTNEFDGAPGVSTRLTYNWQPGRTYRFVMTRGSDDGTGRLWSVDVTDLTTSTTTAVATIKVPSAWGALTNSPIIFSEHYGPSVTSCSMVRYSSVRWENLSVTPLGGGTAVTPSAWVHTWDNSSPCSDGTSTTLAAGIRQQMGATAPAKLLVEAWSANNLTYLGDLDESFGRSFQDELSGLGRGQVSVLSATNDASLDPGVLRFKVATPEQLATTGGVYAFASRVEQKQWRYDQGEDSTRGFTLSGRGLVSAWEDAVVFPYGGINSRPISDSREFTWTSPELDTSGWASAVTVISGLAPNDRVSPPTPDPWFPPKGWSSVLSGSDWIWSRNASAGTPEGASLFRTTFSLASADRVAIFYTASSRCRVWIDGVLLTSGWTSEPNEESFLFAHRATPYCSSGTHYLAVEAESKAWTPTLPGVARGILNVAVHSGGGSGVAYASGNLLVGTSSSWKTLDYPTVYPAPTPGRIVRQLLEEAQARGALTGWALGCTDTVDSAGQPWSVDQAQVFRIGQTYADVLRQMADASIEFRARPAGLVLDLYRKDAVITTGGPTFTIGTNLAELEEDQPK